MPVIIAFIRPLSSMYDHNLCTPKAEVTGSNPVGCANDFNGLVSVASDPK
jgi:hypothetical protein